MSRVNAHLFEQLVELRRDFHRHPELSWQEYRTSDQVCGFLDQLPGITYRRDVAGVGIVAEIANGTDGPWVALRADMDALPVQEETQLPFASDSAGVMHACGHDAHMTIALGAAALLAKEAKLPAPIRLLFQPAEETGDGAKAMIEADALQNVGMIFGGHVDRHYPVGTVVVTDGPVNASSDQFTIHIQGKGGHAARPHETIDAVVVGALLVMAVQTIVSREINPSHPSVVTVGRFEAGSAHNVIADHARLMGTVRAQDPEVRLRLEASLRRIANSIGQLHDADVEVEFQRGTPELINRGVPVQLARRAASEAVGADRVLSMETANMGGEDFSYYLQHVPGCYVRYGSHSDETNAYPAHSSRFDIDETVLATGASYLAQVAIVAGEYLSSSCDANSSSV